MHYFCTLQNEVSLLLYHFSHVHSPNEGKLAKKGRDFPSSCSHSSPPDFFMNFRSTSPLVIVIHYDCHKIFVITLSYKVLYFIVLDISIMLLLDLKHFENSVSISWMYPFYEWIIVYYYISVIYVLWMIFITLLLINCRASRWDGRNSPEASAQYIFATLTRIRIMPSQFPSKFNINLH